MFLVWDRKKVFYMTNDLQKVKDLLKTRGCSDRTATNYISCLNRFKKFFEGKELKKLKEKDILDYLKVNFIDLDFSAATINVNRAAIKYYYLVNFNIDFNNTLLPSCKVNNRFPVLLSKQQVISIFNNESNLKHKLWIILAYGSGLRIGEVASLKVSDILSKEHKIHNDYLFPGMFSKTQLTHINPFTIKQAFQKIKKNNNLDNSITFHTLRHSFACEYLKSGGDIWELRSLLGHSSINTTMVYLHMAEDFSKVYSPLDEVSNV